MPLLLWSLPSEIVLRVISQLDHLSAARLSASSQKLHSLGDGALERHRIMNRSTAKCLAASKIRTLTAVLGGLKDLKSRHKWQITLVVTSKHTICPGI